MHSTEGDIYSSEDTKTIYNPEMIYSYLINVMHHRMDEKSKQIHFFTVKLQPGFNPVLNELKVKFQSASEKDNSS